MPLEDVARFASGIKVDGCGAARAGVARSRSDAATKRRPSAFEERYERMLYGEHHGRALALLRGCTRRRNRDGGCGKRKKFGRMCGCQRCESEVVFENDGKMRAAAAAEALHPPKWQISLFLSKKPKTEFFLGVFARFWPGCTSDSHQFGEFFSTHSHHLILPTLTSVSDPHTRLSFLILSNVKRSNRNNSTEVGTDVCVCVWRSLWGCSLSMLSCDSTMTG